MKHTQLTKRTWRHTGTVAWYQDALVGQYYSNGELKWFHLTPPESEEYGDCYRLPVIDGFQYLTGQAPPRSVHDFTGLDLDKLMPRIRVTDMDLSEYFDEYTIRV